MKFTVAICILIFSCVFISCESSKLKRQAERSSLTFFENLREGNIDQIKKSYPAFINFSTYYKSDSAKINYSSFNNNIITVSIHNKFTNVFGKRFEKDILFFFKKNKEGELTLYDSKGLSDFDDDDEYLFGIKTGCIDKNTDTTDQLILKALQKAQTLLMDKAVSLYSELRSKVQVTNWSWESGWGGSASGQGIVKNNSTYSIPNLKYKITYKDYSGNEITTDDGYVDYGTIKPYQSKSFTFYTSYVANASKASIELIFNDEDILNYLKGATWEGNECQDYLDKITP